MDISQALDCLRGFSNRQKAVEMAAYHKVDRAYLGVANPAIGALVKEWRKETDLGERLELAAGLWKSNIHEARIAAAKMLEQARFRPDDTGVWYLIASWVPDFDAWATADHASIAGQKRLVADPTRVDEVERWTKSDHMWTRRAALVMTLPWARMTDPTPDQIATRERILGWAAEYVPDQAWFIQKAVAWWLRDLSKRDPNRVRLFLDAHGGAMKPFARREAAKYL